MRSERGGVISCMTPNQLRYIQGEIGAKERSMHDLLGGFGAIIGRCLGNPRTRTAFNGTMADLLVPSLLRVFR